MSPDAKGGDHTHVVNNGKRELTIDELARTTGIDSTSA